jgi:uncharacterized protein (DUF2141 family)
MVRIFLSLLVTSLITDTTEVFARDSVDVHVKVTGFRNHNGSCRLLLFGSEEGFPDSPGEAVAVRSEGIRGEAAGFTFRVKPGMYAVVVLHDENANGEMDRTWYGRPKEGFGTSGNSGIGSGPPEFEESMILLDEQNNTLTIAVNYL